jgi:hypothetical protein
MITHNFNGIVYLYIWYHWYVNRKLREELITYFPLTWHGLHRKWYFQQLFVAAGATLLSCYLATRDTQTHRHACPTILLLVCVFVATGVCLLSHCLPMKGRIQITEPFPSSDRRDTPTDIQTIGRDLWRTVEMGSGTIILSCVWVCARLIRWVPDWMIWFIDT